MTKPAQKSCLSRNFRPKTPCRLLAIVLNRGRGPPPTASHNPTRHQGAWLPLRKSERWRVPKRGPRRSHHDPGANIATPPDARHVYPLRYCTCVPFIYAVLPHPNKKKITSHTFSLSLSLSHSLSLSVTDRQRKTQTPTFTLPSHHPLLFLLLLLPFFFSFFLYSLIPFSVDQNSKKYKEKF